MKIEAIEIYLPDTVITNIDLENEFPNWSSHKIESKVGISKRHISKPSETALDLGEQAALSLFKKIDKEKIDFLLFCSQSPDYFLPTTACILQRRLDLNKSIGALDYNLGCSGYIYGLALAKGLISAKIANNVLLITAETYSKHVYVKDIANRAIFGDGASASLITNSNDNFIGEFSLGTDGEGEENLIVKNGAFKYPKTVEPKELAYGDNNYYTENHLYMNGPEIFNFTIEKIPLLVKDVLIKNNCDINDIDYFVFHQANKFMLNYLRRKTKIPKNKFYINIENTGNTVSNTIPIALDDCLKNNLIPKGSKIMLVGFGVGYSWGATIVTI